MNQPDPYHLDPLFERAVLALAATHPRFWGVIGHALDTGAMGHPLAKLVLETCAAVAKDTGKGPSSGLIFVQRLRTLVGNGKVTADQVAACSALIDDAEDYGLPDVEAVIAELTPLLRRRLQAAAVMGAHDEFANHGDFSKTVGALTKAHRLGQVDTSMGSRLSGGFRTIADAKNLMRLPTGVLELDIQMNDGLARKQLGVALGGAGDGKSMWLVQQACEGARRQLRVGLATLELGEDMQLARIYANLTGIPISAITDHEPSRLEAQRRYEIMAPHLGDIAVCEFPPHAATVDDIRDWVKRCEDTWGEPMDELVVDYADKIYAPTKNDSEYLAMRLVYEGLRRDIAVAMDKWVWTASQAARPEGRVKHLDLQHVADSMHKVRVADVVISLNVEDDQLGIYVAKNRTGKARVSVGPLPMDLERARIVAATEEWTQW